jgi:tetratricopeptide (TPR) repeat protein
MLPVLILAADWVVSGRRLFRRLGVHAAFWGVLLALLAVQYAAGVSGPALLGKQAAFAQLVLPAFAPLKLSVIHAAPASSAALAAVPFAMAVFAALLLLMRSPAGVGLLWFLVGLWCAAGGDPAERNAYLGLAGLAMLVPCLMTVLKPPSLRAAGGLVAAVLVIAAGTGTYMRNSVWRDELTLWGDAVRKAPDSPVAARNLGRAFLNFGVGMEQHPQASTVFQNAEENLRRSLSLDPTNVQARSDLAMAIVRLDRTDEAIPLFLDVLRSDIENQQVTLNVALLLNDKANASGDQDLLVRSVDYFRRADSLKPLRDEPLARYGMALLALGEWEEAEGALQRAVGRDSESPHSLSNPDKLLTPVLKSVQETLKAVRGMEQQSLALLAKDPSDVSGLKMRAQIYALRGQALQSAYVLERLWRENRQDFATWVLTGYVKARMKEAEEFIKDYALPAKPVEVKSAWTEVARACASRGLWDAAKAYLESPGAGAEGLGPALLVLADIAQEVRQGPRAQEYLEQATRAYPSDPRPWLRLCDMATPVNASAAARYLSEAQARGADATDVNKRKEKLGGVAVEPAAPGRTIIR